MLGRREKMDQVYTHTTTSVHKSSRDVALRNVLGDVGRYDGLLILGRWELSSVSNEV